MVNMEDVQEETYYSWLSSHGKVFYYVTEVHTRYNNMVSFDCHDMPPGGSWTTKASTLTRTLGTPIFDYELDPSKMTIPFCPADTANQNTVAQNIVTFTPTVLAKHLKENQYYEYFLSTNNGSEYIYVEKITQKTSESISVKEWYYDPDSNQWITQTWDADLDDDSGLNSVDRDLVPSRCPIEKTPNSTKTNTTKTIIPANARSPVCTNCGKTNKVVDTGFNTLYYCVDCEP